MVRTIAGMKIVVGQWSKIENQVCLLITRLPHPLERPEPAGGKAAARGCP
jgi:hypothetical protein